MQLEEGKIVEIEELEGTAVINAIKNVDNEIANHEANIWALKNAKEEIIASHPKEILRHDLTVMEEISIRLIGNYNNYDVALESLGILYDEIAIALEEYIEEPSVNEVEEPVEAEA